MTQLSYIEQLNEKRLHWQSLITQWKDSGGSASKFCRENHLNIDQFYYWKRIFFPSDKQKKPADKTLPIFTEVKLPVMNSSPAMTLVLPTGYRLEISEHAPSSLLNHVFSLLKGEA